MFCAGPDGSHKAQANVSENSLFFPWPCKELQIEKFQVFLDKDGKKLGVAVAAHDPDLLGQYKTMACVQDVFNTSAKT